MTGGSPRARGATSRAQQKAATRDRILTAASELFAEQDYDVVTVSAVATRAGVAHGLVFHHFGSKEALYRAVLDAVVAQMDAAFTAPAADDAPTIVRTALRTHLTYLQTHRGVALRLVVGRRHADPTAAAVSDGGRARALAALAQVLGLDAADPVVQYVGTTVVAAFDEATRWWLVDPRPVPVDALVTSLLELGAGALRGAQALDGCPDVTGALAVIAAATRPGEASTIR
ncbi:hypothetical protein GCM10027047_27080 [Rhodococcus aerolatus]